MAEAVAPVAEQHLDPRRWKALAVVLTASFMVLLDISIVNVAIPSIRTSLSASYAQIEWVIAGYQLAYAVSLITGGRLGDIFGRKRLFMLGVTGFTLASAACGLSQSATFLVGARIVQGLMAAMMYPQVLSVIQVNFPPHERGKAFGIFGGVLGVATITGPLAGGLLIQANVLGSTWRPIFLVNVPIGIGAVIAAGFLLSESHSPHAPRLDLPGTLIATVGLFLFAYPLVQGRDAGWPLWTFISIGLSLVVIGLFLVYNNWRARTVGSPLVEPTLFGDRAFVVGLIITAAFLSGVPAFFFTFSVFLQIGHGMSALQAGLTTLPWSLFAAISSGMSIRLAPKLGPKILSVGAALIVLAIVAVLVTINLVGDTGFHGYDLIPAMVLGGLGMGCVVAPLANIILAGIHHGHAGSASGVLTTVQQMGGAIGVTIVGVVFFGLLSAHAPALSSARSAPFQSSLVAQGLPAQVAPLVQRDFSACFNDRATASDPSSNPPSCVTVQRNSQLPAGAPPSLQTLHDKLVAAISDEAQTRLAADFTYAFQRSLIYNLIVWTLVFFLTFLLPKPEFSGRPGAPASD